MTHGKHNLWVPPFEHARLGGDNRTDLRLHLPAAPGVPGDPLVEPVEVTWQKRIWDHNPDTSKGLEN